MGEPDRPDDAWPSRHTRPRIGALAALTSTVGPATRVLAEAAADAGADISLEVSVVDGARVAFISGDAEVYHSRIA